MTQRDRIREIIEETMPPSDDECECCNCYGWEERKKKVDTATDEIMAITEEGKK